MGDNSYYDPLLQYYRNRLDLPAEPQSLIVKTSGDAPVLGLDALPDTATICSCHNVSKGDIICCMKAGKTSLEDVIGETRATTGAAVCAAQVKDLVQKQQPRWAWKSSCLVRALWHSRQELEHIIRVEGVRSQYLVGKTRPRFGLRYL